LLVNLIYALISSKVQSAVTKGDTKEGGRKYDMYKIQRKLNKIIFYDHR